MARRAATKKKTLPDFQWVTSDTRLDGIGVADLERVYGVTPPTCPEGCTGKGNDRLNPACMHGTGKGPVGGTGIWTKKKAPRVFLKAGDDPRDGVRADMSVPVGLRNLGATCYMNALLQCLFMNKKFRNGVYRWAPSAASAEGGSGDEVIAQRLQELFAHLECSKGVYFTPRDFVDAVGLNSGEQQDVQEFCKLLLHSLESTFAGSRDRSVRSLVADQFRGQLCYETSCKTCGNKSVRNEDFYELNLPLPDAKSNKLEDCIRAFETEEELTGDNQYLCQACADHGRGKQDATRRMRILKLPEVLFIHLMRFVYDPTKNSKLKVTNPIEYPEQLELDSILNVPDVPPYKVTAICEHLGPGANCGHYIAQIRTDSADGGEDIWWDFNDQNVRRGEVGKAPVVAPPEESGDEAEAAGEDGEENGDEDGPKPKKKGTPGRKKKKGEEDNEDYEDGEEEDGEETDGKKKKASKKGGKKGGRSGGAKTPKGRKTKAAGDNDVEEVLAPPKAVARKKGGRGRKAEAATEDGAAGANAMGYRTWMSKNAYMLVYTRLATESSTTVVPEKIRAIVDNANTTADTDKEKYEANRKLIEAYIQRTKDTFERVKAEQAKGIGAEYYWIPTAWWGEFVVGNVIDDKDLTKTQPIDCSDLVCEHGKLDPQRVGRTRRLNKDAYRVLADAFGPGVPELSQDAICDACVKSNIGRIHASTELSSKQGDLVEAIARSVEEAATCRKGVWVSAAFVKGIKGTKDFRKDCATFDQVRCDCDMRQLTPRESARTLIGEDVAFDIAQFAHMEPGPFFAHDEAPCPTCKDAQEAADSQKQADRSTASEQKQKLSKLFRKVESSLSKEVYYLVSEKCFAQPWREYCQKPGTKPQPTRMDNSDLVCDHGKLLFEVDYTFLKNGAYMNDFSVVTQTAFNLLKDTYGYEPTPKIELLVADAISVDVCQAAAGDAPPAAAAPVVVAVDDNDAADLEAGRRNPRRKRKAEQDDEYEEPPSKRPRTSERNGTSEGEVISVDIEDRPRTRRLSRGRSPGPKQAAPPPPDEPNYFVWTNPEACTTCIAERRHLEETARLTYTNGKLNVLIVDTTKGDAAPATPITFSGGTTARPRRSRKTPGALSVGPLTSETNVWQIKWQVADLTGHDVSTMTLKFNGAECFDESTLIQNSVPDGAELVIEIGAPKAGASNGFPAAAFAPPSTRGPEVGFAGSRLVSKPRATSPAPTSSTPVTMDLDVPTSNDHVTGDQVDAAAEPGSPKGLQPRVVIYQPDDQRHDADVAEEAVAAPMDGVYEAS